MKKAKGVNSGEWGWLGPVRAKYAQVALEHGDRQLADRGDVDACLTEKEKESQ